MNYLSLTILAGLLSIIGNAQGTRFSDMGSNNADPAYDARFPNVAFNSTDNEYLVIWYGNDDTAPLVVGETEIHGQLIDQYGAEIGSDFLISNFNNTASGTYEAALYSDVAYNSTDNEYMVVMYGDDSRFGNSSGEYEIYGQRISATGTRVGGMFRISQQGADGDGGNDANKPQIAYNSTDNEYYVVWYGDDDSGGSPLDDGEYEIWGQRISATGTELPSSTDTRLSDMGPDGNASYDAWDPKVAYNSSDNEYMVVWRGDDNTGALVEGEDENYGQRISAAGAEIGSDIRLTTYGTDGNSSQDAWNCDIAYNSDNNTYMLVFRGIDGDYEIFGEVLTAAGVVSVSQFQISSMGPDDFYTAILPSIAYNPACQEFLVTWRGDSDVAPLVNNEYEIFGEILDASGNILSADDFQISDLGPAGNTSYQMWTPISAANINSGGFLTVWEGEDDVNTVDQAPEIYGEIIDCITVTLPVDLTAFEIFCDEKSTKLFWSTASEISNDYFTLERSTDGTKFEAIATIIGAGNSSIAAYYSWTDEFPLDGTVYYRLKQTDFDGEFEYHQTIATNCNSLGTVSIYPNPFEYGFTIDISEGIKEQLNVEVIDFLGRSVYAETLENKSSQINIQQDLPPGTYIVRVFNSKFQQVEKLIKIK